MDGTISKLRFAAKRLVPFHLRSRIELPEANEKLRNANQAMNDLNIQKSRAERGFDNQDQHSDEEED
jgi:hypothetical protein